MIALAPVIALPSQQLALFTASAPAYSAADVTDLAKRICTLRLGDALVGMSYRIEHAEVRSGASEYLVLLRGGMPVRGRWVGGQVIERTVLRSRRQRREQAAVFALALWLRGDADVCVWTGGSGLDGRAFADAPHTAGSAQARLL